MASGLNLNTESHMFNEIIFRIFLRTYIFFPKRKFAIDENSLKIFQDLQLDDSKNIYTLSTLTNWIIILTFLYEFFQIDKNRQKYRFISIYFFELSVFSLSLSRKLRSSISYSPTIAEKFLSYYSQDHIDLMVFLKVTERFYRIFSLATVKRGVIFSNSERTDLLNLPMCESCIR